MRCVLYIHKLNARVYTVGASGLVCASIRTNACTECGLASRCVASPRVASCWWEAENEASEVVAATVPWSERVCRRVRNVMPRKQCHDRKASRGSFRRSAARGCETTKEINSHSLGNAFYHPRQLFAMMSLNSDRWCR